MSTGTHVVRSISLSIGGVLQEQALEAQNFGDGLLRHRCEDIDLEFVNIIVLDHFLQDGVKLVQDLDPGIQIRSWPLPRVDLPQNFMKVFIRSI